MGGEGIDNFLLAVTLTDDVQELHRRWEKYDASLCKNMLACAVCGYTLLSTYDPGKNEFSASNDKFQEVVLETDLAEAWSRSAPHMVNYVRTDNLGDGLHVATVCKACASGKAQERAAHSVPYRKHYFRKLCKLPTLMLQRLSIVNVCIEMTRRVAGFFTGSLSDATLLHAPLVNTTPSNKPTQDEQTILEEVHALNLTENPVFHKYVPFAERSLDCLNGLPMISDDTVESILSMATSRDPHLTTSTTEDSCPKPVCKLSTIVFDHLDSTNTDVIEQKNNARGSKASLLLGYAYLRHHDRLERINTDSRGCSESIDASNMENLTAELAIMPFLFPEGTGHYTGHQSLTEYVQQKFHAAFGMHSLHMPALMIWYLISRTEAIRKQTTQACLKRDVQKYKSRHPDANDQDIYANVVRHSLPATLPGSPLWHKRHLDDLLAAVDYHGMPHLFVTLTSDEFTSTRWPAYDTLSNLLRAIDGELSWVDAPVEAAKIFKERLTTFRKTVLCPTNSHGKTMAGIFGKVKHWIIRYECQGRGSLHAHISLWLEDLQDAEKVWSEITAVIPGETKNEDVIPPDAEKYPLYNRLHHLVKRKQIHWCRPHLCKSKGTCRLKFPKQQQKVITPHYNESTHRFEYYRPRKCDRNVVEYHPLLLLFWGAHCNVQKVTSEEFSRYLLKYQMKVEPSGTLNLDEDASKALGIDDLTEIQRKTAAALLLSRPVCAQEAAMHILGHSMIERSRSLAVDFISTPPPNKRMHIFKHKAQTAGKVAAHAIDTYTARPDSLDHVTFIDYQRCYTRLKKAQCSDQNHYIGMDDLGNHIYERTCPKLIRFTDYNPVTNPEGYFYNQLLQLIPFRHESELASEETSYYESYLQHVQNNTEHNCPNEAQEQKQPSHLQNHILSYAQRHLYSSVDIDALHELAESNLQKQMANTTSNNNHTESCYVTQPFENLAEPKAEQTDIIFRLTDDCSGDYHLLTGEPGCGKTFVTKHVANRYLGLGKKVVLAASTGAAALRLSNNATTAHHLFNINPLHMYLTPLTPQSEMYHTILHADVIIIDECSMLTSQIMNIIIHRLKQLTSAAATANHTYRQPKLILVGDMRQLPPVCTCHQNQEACRKCHLTSSQIYPHLERHVLITPNRCHDPSFLDFLKLIRWRKPTETELQVALSNNVITENSAEDLVDSEHTVLCSHLEDTVNFNKKAISKLFDDSELQSVEPNTNIPDNHPLSDWRDKQYNKHCISHTAIGARVVVTQNRVGTACNGSTGTVVGFRQRQGRNSAIHIKLDDTEDQVWVRRSTYSFKYYQGDRYYVSTWPLLHSYALTIHRCQGLTIRNTIIVCVREAFTPALMYVALSRATSKHNVKITNKSMKTSNFIPAPSWSH
eukprot:scaffold1283_cov18-Prasinocladus_malaysianus.AAC.1